MLLHKPGILVALSLVVGLPRLSDAQPEEPTVDELQKQGRKALTLWRSSCLKISESGDCFSFRTVRPANACQGSTEFALPHKHKRSQASRAQTALASVLEKLTAEKPERAGPGLLALVAEMRFAVAQQRLEVLLLSRAPKGLSFDPKNPKRSRRSSQRFASFIEELRKKSDATTNAYQEVLDLPKTDATRAWHAAATAQTALAYRHFASLLYTMEIPQEVRKGPYASEGVDAYCDAIADAAQPLESRAQALASQCSKLQPGNNPRRSRCQRWQQPIGSLDDVRTVRRIFRSKSREVTTCYEEAAAKEPELAGTMQVTLKVGPQGQVLEASVRGFDAKELESCIAKRLRPLEFPHPQGSAPVDVHESYRFQPGGF